MPSPRIGVVTGLASEAAVATALIGEEGIAGRVVCAGASTERAAIEARRLVDAGVEALLSFGMAGALAPTLDSGDLVIPDNILLDNADDSSIYLCDPGWRETLRAALAEARLPCHGGLLIGSRRMWRDAKDKEAIFENTGGQAIDMESGAVAAIAAEAGLPFLAVRAVADRGRDSLPALVETAVKPDGMPAVGRVIAALIRQPAQLPAVLRMARQSDQALACLRRLEAVKDALFGGF